MTSRRTNRWHALSSRLGLTLWLTIPALGGCDSEDDLDEAELTERIAETQDDASPPSGIERGSSTDPRIAPEDECGSAHHHDAVALRWHERADGQLQLDAHLHEPLGPGDEAQARFRITAMPVDEQGVRDIGSPIVLTGDQSLDLPPQLLEVIDGGGAHAVFVIASVCREDEPQGNCLSVTSEELYIEDGRAMRPEAYEQHLRKKWSEDKPWLFDEGHPTHIIDMKGR